MVQIRQRCENSVQVKRGPSYTFRGRLDLSGNGSVLWFPFLLLPFMLILWCILGTAQCRRTACSWRSASHWASQIRTVCRYPTQGLIIKSIPQIAYSAFAPFEATRCWKKINAFIEFLIQVAVAAPERQPPLRAAWKIKGIPLLRAPREPIKGLALASNYHPRLLKQQLGPHSGTHVKGKVHRTTRTLNCIWDNYMTASPPQATEHDGWAEERGKRTGERGRPRRCNTNCGWRDVRERRNKGAAVRPGVLVCRALRITPLLLLRFFYSCLLRKFHNFKSVIMSTSGQAE